MAMQVTAVVMYAVMDGVFQNMISEDVFNIALKGLKLGKTADPSGLNAESV